MKKYELTKEFITVFGKKLFRIKALRSFGSIKEGDLGGFIESEENLDHEGDAWIKDDAMVSGNARVSGNALVFGQARVYGQARVLDNALVYGQARVSGNAKISNNAAVSNNARVSGNAWLLDDAWASGNAEVYDNALVYGKAVLLDGTVVLGSAKVYGTVVLRGDTEIYGEADICRNKDWLVIRGVGSRGDSTTFFRSGFKKILVSCGCFKGDIDEFEKAVETEHTGSKHEKTYKLAIELAKAQVELED